MAQNKKTNRDLDVAVGIGVGLAALAGAYFLYGKDGSKNRKKIKGWMLKAKGDVLDRLEKMKDVSEEKYQQVVEDVMKRYEKMKDIDAEEVQALAKNLQGHWKNIKRELDASLKTAKTTPKVAKKTVKKAKDAVKKSQ